MEATILVGSDIDRYAAISVLTAARLELAGIRFNGSKRLSVLKRWLGLQKRHSDVMTFMHANQVFYVHGLMGKSLYEANLEALKKYGK